MQAGKLRSLIAIEEPLSAKASSAGAWGKSAVDGPWREVWKVRADVQDLDASEQMKSSDGVKTAATHRIRTRYIPGLTTRHRIRHNERILEITSVRDPHQRRRELVIEAVQHIDRTTDGGT